MPETSVETVYSFCRSKGRERKTCGDCVDISYCLTLPLSEEQKESGPEPAKS